MDLETLENINSGAIVTFTPKHTNPIIACANCGNPMESQGVAICPECIRLSVDITRDIQKSGTLVFCRKCGRLQVPPSHWVYAPPESRELLAAILKRIRGLSKVRLVDARFIWTEPHSRRLKLKISVQGEAEEYQNTVVQQSFEAEFVEQGSQCPDCAKSYTANTWVASIQVRQRVAHKRTFFYLEQLILKHKAHKNTVNIQENKEGLDFYYNDRKYAVKMMEFLQSVIPVKVKKSEEFISQDTHTSKKTFKFTYHVEIVPITKDDLVVLPKKIANSLGLLPTQLVLCRRIAHTIHFLDPTTIKTAELTAANYWKTPFGSLETMKNLTEYVVLDVDQAGESRGNLVLCDVTVARSSDLGVNDTTYYVRSHLGGIIHPGDTVMGYDLENANWNSELWDGLDKDRIPSVILVKKVYDGEGKRKAKKKRNWRLKRMAVEHNEREQERAADAVDVGGKGGGGGGGGLNKQDAVIARQERDYEDFLEELEQDEQLRSDVNFYADGDGEEVVDDDDYDDDLPEIGIDELKIDSEEEE
ncbi:uncharacterized protein SAPINGB_P004367 [Magnusiomyces paraingens]|uniref:60S ribosomal export protein NMD3 n=1 Tax=Magnusiomyces paraingens TaxID=2606893 RepID=A0A5E8BU46_9ASCO|nr:uncharacterized protein SAPINGB_P004367 [Saprochaete ingens]VVT54996.1 unnamed protein product [Saprochaete ingens]